VAVFLDFYLIVVVRCGLISGDWLKSTRKLPK